MLGPFIVVFFYFNYKTVLVVIGQEVDGFITPLCCFFSTLKVISEYKQVVVSGNLPKRVLETTILDLGLLLLPQSVCEALQPVPQRRDCMVSKAMENNQSTCFSQGFSLSM